MKLILCGGGSGDKNVLANQKLNQVIDNSKSILYIPLALNELKHTFEESYEWVTNELSSVNYKKIDMVRSFEELSYINLENYTALYIGGGNTYKLLSGLKQYNIFNKIKKYLDNDGIVIGGSAGAVIFGYDIDIISSMDNNEVNLIDTKGFNYLNGVSIFPHYTNKKEKLTEEENKIRMNIFENSIIEFSKKVGEVIAIPEEDAIYIDNNIIEVIGTKPYYKFNNGMKEKFEIK